MARQKTRDTPNRDYWNRGFPEPRISRTEDFQNRGFPEPRISRTEDFQNRGLLEPRIIRTEDFQNRGLPRPELQSLTTTIRRLTTPAESSRLQPRSGGLR